MKDFVKNILVLYPLLLIYYFTFCVVFSKLSARIPDRKIQKIKPSNQIKVDVQSSIISLFIAAVCLSIGIYCKVNGLSVESSFTNYSIINFILSVFIGLLILDTAVYWFHRGYHVNRTLMRIFHVAHHKNNNTPTVWGTYKESHIGFFLVQSFFIYIVFIIPISIPALIFLNFFAMSIDILGHSGYNISAKSKIFTNVEDHDLHHRQYNYNYAPYFVFWDKIFRTYKG